MTKKKERRERTKNKFKRGWVWVCGRENEKDQVIMKNKVTEGAVESGCTFQQSSV